MNWTLNLIDNMSNENVQIHHRMQLPTFILNGGGGGTLNFNLLTAGSSRFDSGLFLDLHQRVGRGRTTAGFYM